MDEKSLAALMATMFSTILPTLNEPEEPGMGGHRLPVRFGDLPQVFRGQGQGEGCARHPAKDNGGGCHRQRWIITYSDIMGALMSSVTKIVGTRGCSSPSMSI